MKPMIATGTLRKRTAAFFRKAAVSADAWMGYILLIFLLAGLAGCLAIWYSYVKAPGWSEARQEAYEKGKSGGTVLDERKLDKALSRFQEREKNGSAGTSGLSDIFRLKD